MEHNITSRLIASVSSVNVTATGMFGNEACIIFIGRVASFTLGELEACKSSPMKRPDLENVPLQVGVYHASYGEAAGYGAFKNFKLIQRK